MRVDFCLFLSYFKGERFLTLLVTLSDVEFHCAGDFVGVHNFELFANTVGMLAWYKGAKVEALFFVEKYVTVDLIGYVLVLSRNDHLFFKDNFKVFTIDTRDTALTNEFILNSLWLVLRISARDVDGKFLFEQLLSASVEDDFNEGRRVRRYASCTWIDSKLTNFQQTYRFTLIFSSFGWFFILLSLFFSFFVFFSLLLS